MPHVGGPGACTGELSYGHRAHTGCTISHTPDAQSTLPVPVQPRAAVPRLARALTPQSGHLRPVLDARRAESGRFRPALPGRAGEPVPPVAAMPAAASPSHTFAPCIAVAYCCHGTPHFASIVHGYSSAHSAMWPRDGCVSCPGSGHRRPPAGTTPCFPSLCRPCMCQLDCTRCHALT